jgi:hypothetical protein
MIPVFVVEPIPTSSYAHYRGKTHPRLSSQPDSSISSIMFRSLSIEDAMRSNLGLLKDSIKDIRSNQ